MDGSDRVEVSTRIARLATRQGARVATAESLTGGLLASDLALAPHAALWYRGGVVACAPEVRRDVLYVRSGPIVSERAVLDMADGVALLLGATVAVAVSGVAGPLPSEGSAPGTVWFGVRHDGSTGAELHHFAGAPDAVCEATRDTALDLLLRGLDGAL